MGCGGEDKAGAVMRKFKRGTLHSGTGRKGKKGPVVTSREQAQAIAVSEAGTAQKSLRVRLVIHPKKG